MVPGDSGWSPGRPKRVKERPHHQHQACSVTEFADQGMQVLAGLHACSDEVVEVGDDVLDDGLFGGCGDFVLLDLQRATDPRDGGADLPLRVSQLDA